jgi:hypothetical protein
MTGVCITRGDLNTEADVYREKIKGRHGEKRIWSWSGLSTSQESSFRRNQHC